MSGPDEPTPLLEWLLGRLAPMSRTRLKELLQKGRIQINGTVTTQFDRKIGPSDQIEVVSKGIPAPQRHLGQMKVIHADESLMVVEKPAGLLVVGTERETHRTAVAGLNRKLDNLGMGRAVVVHRLDRDTSGLLLFARSQPVRDQLQAHWDRVEKTYLAVIEGAMPQSTDRIESHLIEGEDRKVREMGPVPGSKLAITEYRVLARDSTTNLLEVKLITGRKHQIRVHLAGRGCPIVGDHLYGARSNPMGRLGLHAWKLSLVHPKTGRLMTWESPPPRSFLPWVKRQGDYRPEPPLTS